jgi:TPR repeat protein
MVLILVGLLPTTANAGSVVNECKTGAECVDLGFKYITGKDVKQDDFKALKFFQKACGLNDGSGCSILGYLYGRGKGVKQDDFKALKKNSFTH